MAIKYLFALQYIGGKYDDSDYTEILEFSPPTDPTNPRTGQWKLVANMTRGRSNHAVSVIDYSQVAQFCTEDWEVTECQWASDLNAKKYRTFYWNSAKFKKLIFMTIDFFKTTLIFFILEGKKAEKLNPEVKGVKQFSLKQ